MPYKLILSTLLPILFFALNLSAQPPIIDSKYVLIAHRGGVVEGKYAEYDPRSIDEAIERGYAMLEIDLRATADREIVLHHDRDLNKEFGVNKTTEELTLVEIKQLKAKRGGFSLMSLDELCQRCEGNVGFMLDIKYKNNERWFFDKIVETLSRYGVWERTIVLSSEFEPMLPTAKFGFGANQIKRMTERIDTGEAIDKRYYLFDIAANITPEVISWCQENRIDMCPAINIFRYKKETMAEEVQKHIELLTTHGITHYQIDSDFDIYFRNK